MSANATIIIADARNDQPKTLAEQLTAALAGRTDVAVLRIPHLYDLAPDGPTVRRLQAITGDLLVFSALDPRAAHWAIDAFGVKGGPERKILCLDLRTFADVPSCLDAIGVAGMRPSAVETAAPQPEAVLPRWYPVVDYDRCVNCLECLNFCLFGVYGLDEAGRILVEEPDACRDGCPACARVCPATAILFPMHADALIAGGEAPAAAPLREADGLDRLVDALDESDV